MMKQNRLFKALFVLVLVVLGSIRVLAQEPYAVLSDNNTVLTFYYDDKKVERNGMSVGPFDIQNTREWNTQRESITTVVFDDSFANETTLSSTAFWFFGCTNLSIITGISNLKTDNVTNMNSMFCNCSALTSLDVSNNPLLEYVWCDNNRIESIDINSRIDDAVNTYFALKDQPSE